MENEKTTREPLPEGAYKLLDYLITYHPRQVAQIYAKENCLDDIKDIYQYYGYSEDLLDHIDCPRDIKLEDARLTETNTSAAENPDAFKSFLNKYTPGSIIFPEAVARHLHISAANAYKKLDEHEKTYKNIHKMYLLRCPSCGRFLWTRYYAIVDIPTNVESCCVHCDSLFIPNPEKDGCVVYEKE